MAARHTVGSHPRITYAVRVKQSIPLGLCVGGWNNANLTHMFQVSLKTSARKPSMGLAAPWKYHGHAFGYILDISMD